MGLLPDIANIKHKYKFLIGEFIAPKGQQLANNVRNLSESTRLSMKNTDGIWIKSKNSFIHIAKVYPNKIVQEAIEGNRIPALLGYDCLKREVRYGENSRIDILLASPEKPLCYVEVKNVTLKEGKGALFPDAVTTRGQKHLNELMAVIKAGDRGALVFLVQWDNSDIKRLLFWRSIFTKRSGVGTFRRNSLFTSPIQGNHFLLHK